MICMSLDVICISKRAINLHPLISIKANGITSHYNGQPRTVTSSYKFAAPTKDEKANLFDQIILRFKLEALYSVKYLKFTFTGITCNNNNNNN